MIYLILIMVVYGIANIIVHSSITYPIRQFFVNHIPFIGKLLNCMMCVSFWLGVGIYSYMWFLGLMAVSLVTIPLIIAFGGFFSGTSWLIHTIQEKIEKEPQ